MYKVPLFSLCEKKYFDWVLPLVFKVHFGGVINVQFKKKILYYYLPGFTSIPRFDLDTQVWSLSEGRGKRNKTSYFFRFAMKKFAEICFLIVKPTKVNPTSKMKFWKFNELKSKFKVWTKDGKFIWSKTLTSLVSTKFVMN